jgi:hypothetical protein
MVVPSSSKRDQILKLIAERDSLEIKIREQGRVLQAVGIFLELNSGSFARKYYVARFQPCRRTKHWCKLIYLIII